MKQGICVKIDNRWAIRYKCPEGAGLGYCEVNVESDSIFHCEENKTVYFELIPYHHISGGLQPFTVDLIGNKGLKHHEGHVARILSPHAGVSKLGTGPGSSTLKQDIISPTSVPEPNIISGKLFFTDIEGWIVKYDTTNYKFKDSVVESKIIKVHPKQTSSLSKELDNGKNILFSKKDFYVEPPDTIHCNRGNFIKVAEIIENENNFNLFNPETKNHEVFAIKGNEAFIGYKLPNGNFHFQTIPYTEPKDSESLSTETVEQRFKKYTKEQIEFKNVEDYHETWFSAVCQYWYNQGKKDK